MEQSSLKLAEKKHTFLSGSYIQCKMCILIVSIISSMRFGQQMHAIHHWYNTDFLSHRACEGGRVPHSIGLRALLSTT
jgi:hypothetical protein